MTSKKRSHSRYWTFEQALAWVLYRREDIVSYVGPRSSGSLSLVAMYPTNFKPIANKTGYGEELLTALRNGDLVASGYNEANAGTRQVIPPEDWLKLRIYGGEVFRISDDKKRTLCPWRDIILESGEVKKRFRSQSEVTSRTNYDWVAIKQLYEEIHSKYPNFSQNELITEVQGAIEESLKRSAPSRTSLQTKIKGWS